MDNHHRWVIVWGNADSVAENRPERYAKNITIRYPIHIPFAGCGVRLTFDNYCGTEAITLHKVTVFYGGEFYPVTYQGNGRSPSKPVTASRPILWKSGSTNLKCCRSASIWRTIP